MDRRNCSSASANLAVYHPFAATVFFASWNYPHCDGTARRRKRRYIPRRKTIIGLIKLLDADPWEAIEFEGVITARQSRILEHFTKEMAFTHGDCIKLLGFTKVGHI